MSSIVVPGWAAMKYGMMIALCRRAAEIPGTVPEASNSSTPGFSWLPSGRAGCAREQFQVAADVCCVFRYRVGAQRKVVTPDAMTTFLMRRVRGPTV